SVDGKARQDRSGQPMLRPIRLPRGRPDHEVTERAEELDVAGVEVSLRYAERKREVPLRSEQATEIGRRPAQLLVGPRERQIDRAEMAVRMIADVDVVKIEQIATMRDGRDPAIVQAAEVRQVLSAVLLVDVTHG